MNEPTPESVGIPPLATLTREAYDQMLATGMLFEIYPAATGDHTQDLIPPGDRQHFLPAQPSMALGAVIERMKRYTEWRAGADPRDMTAAGILPGQITRDTLALIEAAEDLLGAQDRLDAYWRTHPTVAGACDAVMKELEHNTAVRVAALAAVGAYAKCYSLHHHLGLAHRILAANTVDGVHHGPVQNLAGPAKPFIPETYSDGRCVHDTKGHGDCQFCCDTPQGCPHRPTNPGDDAIATG